MNRFSPRRLFVFLRRISLLDRIAISVLFLYSVIEILSATGTNIRFPFLLKDFLAVLAVVYLVVRLIPWVRHQFMWRLRNRLIVAYVFIAVVPVILLLTIAGVGSYLLYLQLGAHILHDDLADRTSTLSAATDAISGAIQREAGQGSPASRDAILSQPSVASLIQATRVQLPGLRVFLDRGQALLNSGDGHRFAGLVAFENGLYFASTVGRGESPGAFSVLAIAPVTPAVLDSLSPELGPIQLTLLNPAPAGSSNGFKIDGQKYVNGQHVISLKRALAPPVNRFDMKVTGVSTLQAVYAEPNRNMAKAPVMAHFTVRASALNHLLFASLGELGPLLIDLLAIAGIVFLVLEVGSLITGIVLTRTITSTVADLYDATLHVRRGDFNNRVRVQHHDQLGSLGESFNEMTSSITDLIERQRQLQRLENEVSVAREVQRHLFPKSIPSIPGIELAAICRPARTVSGDYYDFIPLGSRRLGIALADISGKGISAALLMASLQADLRSQAMLDGAEGTAGIISRLNRHLFHNSSDDRYATLFYGVYDAETGILTYTNAGHLPPFFVVDGKLERLEEGGTVVGLFENCPYTQGVCKVKPGSTLVAFSDGLTEPENVYGEEFGIERLKEEVLRPGNLPLQRVAENLISAAEQWAGTPEQADDMTVVIARMG